MDVPLLERLPPRLIALAVSIALAFGAVAAEGAGALLVATGLQALAFVAFWARVWLFVKRWIV